MTYVTTKKELKEAVKRKDTEIIVSEELAQKIKGFDKLKMLSKNQMASLITFVTGSGAVAIAAIAAGVPTGGLSVAGATAFLMAAAPAAGVSIGTVMILIALIGTIGLSATALIKDYDFEARVGNTFYFKAKNSKTTVDKYNM